VSITTYDELKSAIADFLNRDDLTSVIPTFISLAEADMNRKVRHWRMENRATAEVDGRYSAIPPDFLEPIRLHLEGDQTPLESISSYRMQELRQSSSDALGQPKYYCLTQGEIEIFPTPRQAENLEMYYVSRVPSLSASNETNLMLQYHPDIYLYGSLSHSALYLGEDARINQWVQLYVNAVESANQESSKAKSSGSGLRMKIRSY
jgi:hypothetical protein